MSSWDERAIEASEEIVKHPKWLGPIVLSLCIAVGYLFVENTKLGTQEDPLYYAVQELTVAVKSLNETMHTLKTDVEVIKKDHENRLKRLEKDVDKLQGD